MANPDKARLPKLQPIDYLFMIGGPILFLVVAFFGMRAVIGPVPRPSAVQRIKDGEIKPGTPVSQVLHELGTPQSVSTNPDGSTTLIYTRTVADPDLQVEEGIVQVTQSGEVLSTTVDRQLPTRPGS